MISLVLGLRAMPEKAYTAVPPAVLVPAIWNHSLTGWPTSQVGGFCTPPPVPLPLELDEAALDDVALEDPDDEALPPVPEVVSPGPPPQPAKQVSTARKGIPLRVNVINTLLRSPRARAG